MAEEEDKTSTFLVGQHENGALTVEKVANYRLFEGTLTLEGVDELLAIFAPGHWTYVVKADQTDGN